MPKTIFLFLCLLLTATLFHACDFDTGLDALESKVSGRVIFDSLDQPPSNIDEVRVIAVGNFPPQGFGDVFLSDAIRFDLDTADYEIPLPHGVYPAVAVLWKARGRDWEFSNLLGIHGFRLLPPGGKLQEIELSQENPVVGNVDIFAYWGLTSFDARAEGRIEFRGDWPDDTEALLIGAFTKVPDLENIISTLLFLGGIDFTVPQFVDEYNYRLPVRNGDYELIGLFWKGTSIDWEEIKLVGFLADKDNPAAPARISVGEEETITGLDFVVDFNTLPDGITFGQP